ncbi:hypothetical protein [Streptomyces sp. NPDC002491]
MSALQRAREYFDRIDGTLTGTGSDWVQLVGTVGALLNALETCEGTSEHTATPAPTSRLDALKAAREHVEAVSTNSCGFQDGVKLPDKVQAVDRFARFLMGETE